MSRLSCFVCCCVASFRYLLQEQSAGGCSYARTCCTLQVPDCLSWIEELRVHHIEFFAGFAGLLPPPAEVQPPLAAAAGALQHNALQAMPCGSAEAAGVGLLSSLFSFSLEDDPIMLGLAKPTAHPPQQHASLAGNGGDSVAGQRLATPRDASQGPEAAGDAHVAASVAPAARCGGSRPGLQGPEGLVSPAVEDFLLQADPLRLALKSGAAAKAYLQQQLQMQQLLQEQQQLLQQGGEHSVTEALDASLCPHYRIVCSVATR